tara:strand:+ start:8962 stop:10494 length:1533 start_codon:yes stop_codon:yes gene_type:complete
MKRRILRNIYSTFELQGFKSNIGTETVTAATGFKVKKTTHTNEYYDENIPSKYVIVGRVKRNVPQTIATIKVEAETDKYFKKPPTLNTSFGNNISLSITNIEKSNSNIISYTLNLIYVNSKRSSKLDGLSASLRYQCGALYTREIAIDSFLVGPTQVSADGESRPITIKGDKDAVFALAINDDDGNSILNSSLTNSTIVNDYGVEIPIIKRKIGKGGVYQFVQKFPSISAVNTSLSANVSADRTVIVKNGTGIKLDDKVIMKKINKETTVTVSEINPAGGTDSINELLLSSNVTASSGDGISFQRQRTYTASLIPSLSSTFGSNIPTTYPTYTFNQYIDPILTLKVSTGETSFKINGGAAGAEYYQYIQGRANSTKRSGARGLSIIDTAKENDFNYTNAFKVTLSLAVVNTGSHTFTAIRKPVFSRRIEAGDHNNNVAVGTPAAAQVDGGSDWTNTIPGDNGGTKIRISNITAGSSGATTLTITYDVKILQYGNEDVTMELDLDKILTVG